MIWRIAFLLFLGCPYAVAQNGSAIPQVVPLGFRYLPDCSLGARPVNYSCGHPSLPPDRLVELTVDSAAFRIPEEVVAARYLPGEAAPFVALVRHDGRAARPGWEEPFPVVLSETLRVAFEAIGPFEIHRAVLPPFGPETHGDGYDLSTLYLLVVPSPAERDAAVARLRRTDGVRYAGAPVQVHARASTR